jgi:hypothetical protein
MQTLQILIYPVILFVLNSSIALAQYPPASVRQAEEKQIPSDHQYGDNRFSNYIKVTTPDGRRTFFFEEVTLLKDKGYTLHFPLFGIKPEILGRGRNYPIADLVGLNPDYFDRMSQVSIAMNSDSAYSFPRNVLRETDCVLTSRFIYNFWKSVSESGKGNITHSVSKSGRNQVIDFSARSNDFPGYQFEAHVEARPVKAKGSDGTASVRIYNHQDLDVISYPGKYQQFFLPAPGGDKKSVLVSGTGEITYFEFDEFSDQSVAFNKYKLDNRLAGDYDIITPPVKTGHPDPGKLSGESIVPEETISSSQVINLNGSPLFIMPDDRPEGAGNCSRYHFVRTNIPIGVADLPAKQEIAWTNRPFQSFEMINHSMNGFTVDASPGSVTLSYKDYNSRTFETRYKQIVENAGDQSDELIRYISFFSNPLLNKRGSVEIPDDWKEIVKKLGVEGELVNKPRLYLPAVIQNYELEKRDLLIVHYMLTRKEYPELEKDYSALAVAFRNRDEEALPEAMARMNGRAGLQVDDSKPLPAQVQTLIKDIEYAFPWLEFERSRTDEQTFTVGNQRWPESVAHTKSLMNLTTALNFEYDKKQLTTTVKQNGEVQDECTFEASAGLFNVSFLVPALTVMDLDKLNEKVLYTVDMGTQISKRTGGIDKARFFLYRATLTNRGEQTVNYLGKETGTILVDVAFNYPPEFSVPFRSMGGYRNQDGGSTAKVWLDKDSRLPVKMEVGYETYWLLPENEEQMEVWIKEHLDI